TRTFDIFADAFRDPRWAEKLERMIADAMGGWNHKTVQGFKQYGREVADALDAALGRNPNDQSVQDAERDAFAAGQALSDLNKAASNLDKCKGVLDGEDAKKVDDRSSDGADTKRDNALYGAFLRPIRRVGSVPTD